MFPVLFIWLTRCYLQVKIAKFYNGDCEQKKDGKINIYRVYLKYVCIFEPVEELANL
jgi:hypothetical protein